MARGRRPWLLHVVQCLLLPLATLSQVNPRPIDPAPKLYGYRVVAQYPHDPAAFTQGLVVDRRCDRSDGSCREVLLESTGMYGQSSVRIVDLKTGNVEQLMALAPEWFAEGLALFKGKLYQLIWQTPQGFIYSATNLTKVGEFRTPLKDGWGISTDGNLLVLSDGTNKLTWVDPEQGFKRNRTLVVSAGSRVVKDINELEVIGNNVWANIWQTECIARINKRTGKVTAWVLMHGLREWLERKGIPQNTMMDVLNGIAWDKWRRRFIITGKYWPATFEVQLLPLSNSTANRDKAETCFTS